MNDPANYTEEFTEYCAAKVEAKGLDDFWDWLRLETPARADEIAERLDTFHRMLPKSYAGFPRGAAAVDAALRALEVQGRVTRAGSDWRWVGKRAKVEPQRSLFA